MSSEQQTRIKRSDGRTDDAHVDTLSLHPSTNGLFHACPLLLAELGNVKRPLLDGLFLAQTFGADKLERSVFNVEIEVEIRGCNCRQGIQHLAVVDVAVRTDLLL